jgi:hypothetical protein
MNLKYFFEAKKWLTKFTHFFVVVFAIIAAFAESDDLGPIL